MKLTHYGHSCVLLDFGPSGGGTRILFDPGSYSSGFDDVRELDAVLITHAHPDHLDADRLSPVMAGNPTARLIVDPGSATALDPGRDHLRARETRSSTHRRRHRGGGTWQRPRRHPSALAEHR